MTAQILFQANGTGAVDRPLHDKIAEVVSVLDYGAVGDGVTDDSAAIQAAIDANKGRTILLPAGHTFLAAGTLLSGSAYNGTRLEVDGVYKLKAAGGTANFQSVTYGGIIFHDVERCSLAVSGMMDGNRAAQDASQQRHLVIVAGARQLSIDGFRCREIRGDGILINRKTFATAGSTNARDIVIGLCHGENSADDGRNLVSIISAEDVTLAGGISIKIGGIINSARMPGGFDIEPDPGAGHVVSNILSGPWTVETAGTSGIAVIGHADTDDSIRNWNVTNVMIAPSIVRQTSSSDAGGGPVFRRCERVTADVTLVRTGDRNAGISVDYCDFLDLRARATGVSAGVTIGFENFVYDSNVHVEVQDHSAAGLLVIGCDRTRFTGNVRGGQGAGSYGVQVATGSRENAFTASISGTTMTVTDAGSSFISLGSVISGSGVTAGTMIVKQLTGTTGGVGTYEVSLSQTVSSRLMTPAMPTQTGVIYSVSVPYDSNNTFGFLTGASMPFGAGTAIRDCSFEGYPNFSTMFGFGSFLPTRNVEGRNFATALPSTGYWARGDIVHNATPSAGGAPGWVCTTEGAAGTFVFKAMANVAA